MLVIGNGTTERLAWGYGSAAVSVLFFGSSYVPVKKVETGDGLFFQLIVCNTLMMAGLGINVMQNFPPFQFLVMAGGAIWALGNLLIIPVIKTIGLGLGTFIIGMFSLASGWASGRFGLFGLQKDIPSNVVFNYIGVGLCVLGGFMNVFVNSEVSRREESSRQNVIVIRRSANYSYAAGAPLLHTRYESTSDVEALQMSNTQESSSQREQSTDEEKESCFDRRSTCQRRLIGCILAILVGLLFGFSFIPLFYVMDNYEDVSQNALDYVLSHFSGSFAAANVFIFLYCIVKANQPTVYPRAILPGFFCGIMWAVAFVGSFIANDVLRQTVTFPIITAGPPVVAMLWGLIVFREIKGIRNIVILGLTVLVIAAGITMTTLSKKQNSS